MNASIDLDGVWWVGGMGRGGVQSGQIFDLPQRSRGQRLVKGQICPNRVRAISSEPLHAA